MSGAENGAERAENRLERSGERDSKNQVDRERSGSGTSSEREWSGERDSLKWSLAMSGIFSAPLTCSADKTAVRKEVSYTQNR